MSNSAPIQPIVPVSLSNDSFSTLRPTKPYQPGYDWDDDERGPYRSFSSRYASNNPSEYVSITKCLKEFYDEEKEKMYIKTLELKKQEEMERNIQAFYGEVLDSYGSEDYQEPQESQEPQEPQESQSTDTSEDQTEMTSPSTTNPAIEPEQDPLFMQTCNRFAYT